jgi:hypothetical protein
MEPTLLQIALHNVQVPEDNILELRMVPETSVETYVPFRENTQVSGPCKEAVFVIAKQESEISVSRVQVGMNLRKKLLASTGGVENGFGVLMNS